MRSGGKKGHGREDGGCVGDADDVSGDASMWGVVRNHG